VEIAKRRKERRVLKMGPKQQVISALESVKFKADINNKRLKIGLIEYFYAAFMLADFIWYCALQPNCMTYIQAIPWKCYSIFGYKLSNYIAPQCWVTSTNLFVKFMQFRYGNAKKCENRFEVAVDIATIAIVSVLQLIMIVFLITNTLPMFIAYIWILIPLVMLAYVTGILLAYCGDSSGRNDLA
ncbi:unnamed protein product, partial [Didymodactylos carnosus]